MNFDFEQILFYAVVITGLIWLLDIFFLAKKRRLRGNKTPTHWQRAVDLTVEYSKSFFPVLLLVFALRSFFYEMYRIPSGSLKPSMLVGDFPLINKFDYGVRLPVIHKKIFAVGSPQRGDIMVLHWPVNPSIYMIKRVIGVPGDRISYTNKILTINGSVISQTFEKNVSDNDEIGMQYPVIQNQENLLGKLHSIYLIPGRTTADFKDIVVPKDMYFVMGDNRDASEDSRYWGFVPDKNIVGKAVMVVMSWDTSKHFFRGDRFFSKIP